MLLYGGSLLAAIGGYTGATSDCGSGSNSDSSNASSHQYDQSNLCSPANPNGGGYGG